MNSPSLLPQRVASSSLLRRALIQSLLLGVFIVTFLSFVSALVLRNVVTDAVISLHDVVPAVSWEAVERVLREQGFLDGSIFRSTLMLIGGLMLISSALLAYLLARNLTEPIRQLTTKVRRLSPGTWQFKATLKTDDEVEILDRTVADLVGRLRAVYDNLEEQIADRTRELKDQYALDRAILESVDQGVICVDTEGKVAAANPSALRMLGVSAEDVLGKRVARVVPLRAHGKTEEAEHIVDTCLRTRKDIRTTPDIHMSLERADSTLVPVLVLVTPLVVDGTPRGAVAVLQDMTQERQVDYMKSEFISLASHQLRTPLSSLRWYGELLSEEKAHMSDEQKDYVREIRSATDRMLSLLNALLHAARLEERGIEPTHSDVDLTAFMRSVGEDAKQLATPHGIHCAIRLPAAPLHAHTDPTLLGIVLQNLIGNAVKYSPKNTTVNIELLARGKNVDIVVRDEGMGIPQDEGKRIFEKFFRAKNVRRIDTDGNGLGLYISKTIVEKLGGQIAFASTEGKGTVFTVTLPVEKTTGA